MLLRLPDFVDVMSDMKLLLFLVCVYKASQLLSTGIVAFWTIEKTFFGLIDGRFRKAIAMSSGALAAPKQFMHRFSSGLSL